MNGFKAAQYLSESKDLQSDLTPASLNLGLIVTDLGAMAEVARILAVRRCPSSR